MSHARLKTKDYESFARPGDFDAASWLLWQFQLESRLTSEEGYSNIFVADDTTTSEDCHAQVFRLLLNLLPGRTAATHLLDVSYRYNTRKGYHALQALKAAFAPPPETYISTLEGSLSTKQSPHEDLESFIARLMLARLMLDRAGTIVPDAKLINHFRDGLRQPDFKSEYDHLLRSRPDTFLEAAKAVRLTSRAPTAESTAAAFLAAPPPSQPSAVKDGKLNGRGRPDAAGDKEHAHVAKEFAFVATSHLNLPSCPTSAERLAPVTTDFNVITHCTFCWSRSHLREECYKLRADIADGKRPMLPEADVVVTSIMPLAEPAMGAEQETDESKAPAEPVESAAACHESKEPEESGEPAAEPDALEASAEDPDAEPKSPHRRNRHLRRRRNHAVRRRNHAARQAACAFLRISEGDYDASSDNNMPGAVTDSSSGGSCTPCDWSPPQERPPTHDAADYPDAAPPSTPDAIDQLIMMTAVDNLCDTASDVDVHGDDGNGDSDSECEHDALERAFHWAAPHCVSSPGPTSTCVRKAGRVEQERMQARHPHQIPASAIHDSYGRINPDVQSITDDELASLGHVDLVIASPPCAPFSAANPHRLMLADPRAGGLYGSIDVVKRLASMQSGGVNFILENVPGAARCHEIVEAMGTPILVRAHELGSTARRDTVAWSNIRDIDFFRAHSQQAQRAPLSVGELLTTHGFSPRWTAPSHLQHGLFSKFVSRRGSYAYRMTTATTDAPAVPGKSMLLLDGEPETPCLDIVAVSMGFPADTLDIPGLSLDQRRMMLGACIDANIGKWLALAIVKASASEVALPSIKSFPLSWVLDTGATSHMVANISDFADYKPISPRWIHGLCARAVGIGTVRTTIPDDNGTAQTVVLRNVLHVPDLAFRSDNQIYRLFSSRQAEEQNAHLQIIINSRGSRLEVGDTVFPVESVDRLYVLHSRIERSGPPAGISLVSAVKQDSKYLWHAKLGHIHERAMDALRGTAGTQVDYSTQTRLPFCHACAMIKATAAPRPRTCHPRPDAPCHMLGCDFWENPTRSLQGNSYVFGAVDYASSWCCILFVRSRAAAVDCLRRVLAIARSMGHTVRALRLDNDSVFHSRAFIAECDAHALRREYSAPYSQFQNGLVERTCRTLWTRGRCMLAYAGLPTPYWQFAIATAAYLHNRTPRSTGAAPMSIVAAAAPDLSHLRVFGCPAYVHQQRAQRIKSDPSARLGVFVGYDALHADDCYLVYFPDTNTTVATRNVTKAVRCKWVFKTKRNADGSLARYKARLVAKGFSQVHGIDYNDTFAPTVKFTTLRIIFSLAAHYGMGLEQTDIDCAFLYADLEEDIYMTQAPEFEQQGPNGEELVYHLKKSVYGLKQAPHDWYLKLREHMLGQGFAQLKTDPGAYIYRSGNTFSIVAIYVDDILICSNCTTWVV
eukprot:jgi/Tetstr1/423742/TSEL_014374.t1